MMGADHYGEYYWCIKSTLSEDGEIYVHADRIEVTTAGVLICWGGGKKSKAENGEKIMLALQPAQWTAVFAASVMDGHAVAVEHWKGEVVR